MDFFQSIFFLLQPATVCSVFMSEPSDKFLMFKLKYSLFLVLCQIKFYQCDLFLPP